MSRLPTPPAVTPDRYYQATRDRANVIADEVDKLMVDGDAPILAGTIGIAASDIINLIDEAMQNDAGGTNVVPHLLATMDGFITELRAINKALGRNR